MSWVRLTGNKEGGGIEGRMNLEAGSDMLDLGGGRSGIEERLNKEVGSGRLGSQGSRSG